jgi:hypothetical protein
MAPTIESTPFVSSAVTGLAPVAGKFNKVKTRILFANKQRIPTVPHATGLRDCGAGRLPFTSPRQIPRMLRPLASSEPAGGEVGPGSQAVRLRLIHLARFSAIRKLALNQERYVGIATGMTIPQPISCAMRVYGE